MSSLTLADLKHVTSAPAGYSSLSWVWIKDEIILTKNPIVQWAHSLNPDYPVVAVTSVGDIEQVFVLELPDGQVRAAYESEVFSLEKWFGNAEAWLDYEKAKIRTEDMSKGLV